MSKAFRLSLIILVLVMLMMPTVQAQEPVYGVFFYLPTCPHCHEVMDNHWPDIESRFGDQLRVIFVDVSTPDGGKLMQSAYDSGLIDSGSVPQLIIGSDVMVGSNDIPRLAPRVIEEGLAKGGIGYPDIPNIDMWFMDAGMGEFAPSAEMFTSSLSDDPANFIAMGVLAFLVLSLILIGFAAWQLMGQNSIQLLSKLMTQIGWWMLLISSLTGFGLGLTLLFGSEELVITSLAILLSILFIGTVAVIGNKPTLHEVPNWLVPVTIIAGIIAAAYLSYVEFYSTDAVCGAMGNCNMVQESDYAQIGGIPIGFMGLAAYVIMLVVWLVGRSDYKQLADSVLVGFAVLGTMFSAYLTFLEPFVIGATCVWCLTSAIVMLSLLWLIVPPVLDRFAPKAKRRKHYDEAQMSRI